MENADSLFKEIGEPIDAVFAVTIPSLKGNEKDIEEIQGKSLIDAAIANGVKHFVLTSVDRGGIKSENTPTYVPHFITKHNVEVHLKSEAAKTASQWWSAMEKNTKLQVVSVKDIGIFAAKALEDPEHFKNRAISLAGDELTFAEANVKFREIYGMDIPRTFGPLGYVTKIMIKDNRLMWKWFDEAGYGADLAECRGINPAMQDFRTWLKESSNHNVV